MKTKPTDTYITTVYLFGQREVIAALGIKMRKNEVHQLYCDGSNKVRVELHRAPYKRYGKNERSKANK